MTLDKRAVKILMETYWSSSGWKSDRHTRPDDLAYAKSKGVMFDPVERTHDQWVEAAVSAAARTRKEVATRAFVASLRSRRLDLRSALGSYAVARHMPVHRADASAVQRCACCGEYGGLDSVDLNVLNFERIKWGGVRHAYPAYIAFDLERLASTPLPEIEPDDLACLRDVLDVAKALPAKARLKDLDKALAKVLPSSSPERRGLIGILGYAGILVNPSKPDFRQDYVAADARERTPFHTDDWPYPVQWWTAACGVNEEAVRDWFPEMN